VGEDPIVGVWRDAAHAVRSGTPDPQVLADWRRCPQILKTDRGSADAEETEGPGRHAASSGSREQGGRS